ncbi:Dihydropteroate synthase [Methanimicrococcus hongohii]|uniref:dihydropteroate synthase n=1 Tax=Methanimicrococcus hongohii TaxID=3028295 RepID=A0AA96ZV54_9EURY|nr:dihydropteroate synthase [Methanimicrococcus sp. Hf6]WNY24472.1 Dihydropteroate synthase [Methanimicrococcus sp. Hf6]
MTFTVKICGLTFGGNHPPHVMGILNLSPESFYKNSVRDSSSILEAAQKMIDDGATMLDIGARSTSPWADSISVEEEKNRLFSALKELSGNISVPISIDTMYADAAEGALNRGADIINDISSLKADVRMGKVIADHDACAILMATQKVPGDPLGMDAVMSSLSNAVSHAEQIGIDPQKIILDPAIGHWTPEKTAEYDFDVINRFEKFKVFEMPILVAVSRKSFLNSVVNKPAEERMVSSLVAASIAAYKGGHIIRTHDVSETADAVKVIYAIKNQKEFV